MLDINARIIHIENEIIKGLSVNTDFGPLNTKKEHPWKINAFKGI